MACRSCVKFLKSAMRGCQDDVNFTLKPVFTGKHFRKLANKGLQKLNAHIHYSAFSRSFLLTSFRCYEVIRQKTRKGGKKHHDLTAI